MRRFIPSQIEEETKVIKNLSFVDVAILFIGTFLACLIIASSLPSWAKITIMIVIGVIFILSVITFDMVKGYKLVLYGFQFLFRKKKYENVELAKAMGIEYFADYVKNGGSYVSVIELNGVDFSILEEKTQDEYISVFAEVIKEIRNGKIVKFEKPLDLSKYIDYNKELIQKLFDRKLEASGTSIAGIDKKLEMLENQNEYLERFHYLDRIYVDGYFLVIVENNDIALNLTTEGAISELSRIGLNPKRVKEEELKVFMNLYLRYDISEFFEDDARSSNLTQNQSNEAVVEDLRTEDAQVAQNRNLDVKTDYSDVVNIYEKGNHIVINGEEMRIIALGKYPYFVANAWGYELFSIPGTKVVFNFSEYPSKNINKRISRSMTELDSRMKNAKIREDEKKKLLMSYQSLDALLEGLQFASEKLYNTECYLTYPKKRHREIMKLLRGKGIKINDLLWGQYDGWVCTNPFVPMPIKSNRERVSPIQSSSVAGMFPFVSKILSDDEGFYLGASTRYPIFFNQFTKTGTRVNHNMVVFGKSGGGKSFFMKKLAMRGALEDRKIFILDPDNEYDYLCEVLSGNWIDVAGERAGRMNPLHVFASMKDDVDEGGNVGDVSSHKLFLDEFFRTVLPDMSDNCRLYLNECITEMYVNCGIDNARDLLTVKPEEFPTFDTLYAIICEKEASMSESSAQKPTLEILKLQIKQFVGDGIYARLWNGPTTLNIENEFNVLNFQSLFANNNTHIANGQMLLLMRFLNQEVVKNRELNLHKGANKKIEIWIDEAHRFIDATFPVALKFMSTMAKQIRKYDGALIVATQNIADFIGVSESMRAMATAVINSCQYSMIFGLLANDINSIKELYSSYNGGLTQQEVDYIGHARQGDALFIVDTNTRLPLHVELYDNEQQYILPEAMRR